MQKKHRQAYVAIGELGLLKVGYTVSVAKRLPGLRKEFKAKGDVLAQIHACDHIEAAYSVESCLISFCGKQYALHSGREWFKAGDFAIVVEEARRLTEKWRTYRYPKPLTDKQRAKLRQQREENEALQRAIRAAWEAEYKKRSAAWRARRHRSANVIQQVVAFALKAA